MNCSVQLTLLGPGTWLMANAVLLVLWDQGEGAGSGAALDDSGWSVVAPETQTGFLRRLYTDSAGMTHRYVVFALAGTVRGDCSPVRRGNGCWGSPRVRATRNSDLDVLGAEGG